VGLLVVATRIAFAVTDPTLPTTYPQRAEWALMFVVPFGAGTAAIFRWQGVTVSREALTVHGPSGRVIPWRDIQGNSLERQLGGAIVVVDESSGRRTRLPAPITGPLSGDRGFEAKYRTIGEWYLALRDQSCQGDDDLYDVLSLTSRRVRRTGRAPASGGCAPR